MIVPEEQGRTSFAERGVGVLESSIAVPLACLWANFLFRHGGLELYQDFRLASTLRLAFSLRDLLEFTSRLFLQDEQYMLSVRGILGPRIEKVRISQ